MPFRQGANLLGGGVGEYAPLATSEDGMFVAGKMPTRMRADHKSSTPSQNCPRELHRSTTPGLQSKSVAPGLQRMATLTDPMRLENLSTPRLRNMAVIDQPTTLRNKIRNVLSSTLFQGAIACLILLNAVVLGFQTDMEELAIWHQLENVFLFIFTLEFLVKVVVYGIWEYFRPTGEETGMNVLDCLIVVLGLTEFAAELVCGEQSEKDTHSMGTLFRIFRVLRILRIFKIMRFLKQLYMLAFGLALAATAIAWVTVLMIFVLYVCSIVLVRTIGRTEAPDPKAEFLVHNFETIPSSMFTLFTLMAQPDLTHYRAIVDDYPLFGLFLFAFVIFGSFGMIALLTGVIGESIFEKNQLRMMENRREREEQHQMMIRMCESIFDDVEVDVAGKAKKEEIKKVIPQVQELFEQENIVYASHEFDGMLDIMDKGDGLLNRQDFCDGVLQIAEGVRPVSIIEIHYEVVECHSQMLELKRSVSRCLTHLERQGNVSATSCDSCDGGDGAMAELRSLVLELRGDVQLLAQASQANANTRCVGTAEYIGQLACLTENVDKCLGHLEGNGTVGTCCIGVGRVTSNSDLTTLEGLLMALHQDMQSLNLRSQPLICSHSNGSNASNLHGTKGISFATLEAMVRETLEAGSVGEMDKEMGCKLKAEARSLAARLAHQMTSLSTDIPMDAGSARSVLENDHRRDLAATDLPVNSEPQRCITMQSIAATGFAASKPV